MQLSLSLYLMTDMAGMLPSPDYVIHYGSRYNTRLRSLVV